MSKKRIVMEQDKDELRQSNLLMDILDEFLGFMNWIDRILGFIKRFRYPSKGGRFGPTVRVTLPRSDKGGKYTLRETTAHLESHGVPCFDYAYDSKNRYFSIREAEYKWAMWLLDGGKGLKHPKTNWKDGPPQKKKATRQPLDVGKLIDRIF